MGERDRPRAYPLYFDDQFFQQFVPALSLFLPLTYIICCQGTKLGRSHKSKGYEIIIIIQMRVWQWIGRAGGHNLPSRARASSAYCSLHGLGLLTLK